MEPALQSPYKMLRASVEIQKERMQQRSCCRLKSATPSRASELELPVLIRNFWSIVTAAHPLKQQTAIRAHHDCFIRCQIHSAAHRQVKSLLFWRTNGMTTALAAHPIPASPALADSVRCDCRRALPGRVARADVTDTFGLPRRFSSTPSNDVGVARLRRGAPPCPLFFYGRPRRSFKEEPFCSSFFRPA